MTLLYSQSYGNLDKSKPSLVLVHGLFGNSDNLSVIRRHFEDDMHVLSVDLPDHGKSPRTKTWSFRNAAEQLVATIRNAGIEKAYLVGHSLGGKVSMLAAHLDKALFEKVVVLDIAPVKYGVRHTNVFNGLGNVNLDELTGRKEAQEKMAEYIVEPSVIAFLLKSLYQDEDKSWKWRFNLSLLERDYHILIDWPFNGVLFEGDITFVKGANSDYILPEHQSTILEQFPKAKAKIVPAGHWLHAEKTQLVNTLLSRVLLDN